MLGKKFIAIYDISDIMDISPLFSFDLDISPETEEYQYLDALLYENYLIAYHQSGFLIFDISNINNIAISLERRWNRNPVYYDQLLIHQNKLYVSGFYHIDVYFPIIKIELVGNYPNPFNPATTIKCSLAVPSNLQINIYNIKGQKVKSLLNEYRPAGEHSIVWNGKNDNGNDVGSGVYFYRMEAEGYMVTKKMVILK